MRPTKKEKAPSLVYVPFHDDVIEAVRGDDGKILVHFKRVCESLGIAWQPQVRKMKDREWCDLVDVMSVAQDGKQRQLTMIGLDSLPMWLATINPLNVREEVKPKLIRYQREVRDVLSAWFLGALSSADKLAAQLAEVKADYENSRFAVGVYQAKVRQLAEEGKGNASRLSVVMRPFAPTHGDYMTLRDFTDEFGVFNDRGRRLTPSEIRTSGRVVSAMSKALGFYVMPSVGCNLYRIDVLQAWRINHDMRCRMTAETFRKVIRGELFK